MRNTDIVKACTRLLAFPHSSGSGTQDAIRKAIKTDKIVVVHHLSGIKLKMNENIKGFIERNGDVLSSIFEFRLSGNGLVMDINMQSVSDSFFEYFDFRDPIIYTYEFYACLIDYGVPFPTTGFQLDSLTKPLADHALLSNSRVVSSRKALTALIICYKQRTHQGTLVFGAVRDVLFALAREMWAQKGPADKCCGPRSKEWRVE